LRRNTINTGLSYIGLTYERDADGATSGPVTVGWLLNEKTSAVIYDPPERLSGNGRMQQHGKSASRCPAVLNMESRYFVIKCPFDLHIAFSRDANGKPVLVNRAGPKGSIRVNKLAQKLHLVAEDEWRYENRPIIQLQLPYLFIADEPVYMTQLSAFAHYRPAPLPGTIFGGRFPINVWPRQLMWAFEWHDVTQDIILKRGEPLFYCQFEGDAPDRAIQLVEAKTTSELQEYIDQISGAVNYVNQTFSLFKAAERLRPEKLVVKNR
jgi:hypothetical protein